MLRLCRRSSPRPWNEYLSLTKAPGSISLQRRTLYEVHDTTSWTAQTRYGSGDSWTGVCAKSQYQRRRRLKDQDFVDHIIIAIAAGQGGDGCVAFHRPSSPRAPRHPYRLGPPSGGNGGRGGDIYLLPDESLSSLASVPRRVKGKPGSNGSGEWRNGRKGKDRVVRVPLGTVVKVVGWGYKPIQERSYAVGEIGRSDRREEETTEGERQVKWVHYPGWAEANVTREEFREAEKWLEKEESRRVHEGRKKWGAWAKEGREIDLDAELREEQEVVDTVNEPLGRKRKELLGYLFASGGAGGLGNPHFCANLSSSASASSSSTAAFARSPKFATRGVIGEVLTLSLELKTHADVALVGRCNVGKSTLIRALTGGRVKSDVGGWEGVTRGVVRGVVRVAHGEEQGEGTVWEGELGGVRVFDESMKVKDGERRLEAEDEEFSPVPTKPGHGFDLYESFRFTITDNPGFVLPKTRSDNRERQVHEGPSTPEEVEELAPITQTIFRSIERAKVLVYVVDLSGDAPWNELQDVMKEVARGRDGGEGKSKIRKTLVVANKADLLVGSEGGEAEVAEAHAKLSRLEEYVRHEMGDGVLEVVPVSAKWGMNLGRMVKSLEGLLLKARV